MNLYHYQSNGWYQTIKAESEAEAEKLLPEDRPYTLYNVTLCPAEAITTVLGDSEYDDTLPAVYHIPAASGFEWQCGKCGAHWTDADSPINAPCYTHSED